MWRGIRAIANRCCLNFYILYYIIIDEITYVAEWDKGIKFAADSGALENCVVILTGSELTLMQSARMTFPGRQGDADKVDFHLYSLSFYEFLTLKNSIEDLADNRFWPVEVKWRNQQRTKDLTQLCKYQNGQIFAKIFREGNLQGIPMIPLPLGLLRLPTCPVE